MTTSRVRRPTLPLPALGALALLLPLWIAPAASALDLTVLSSERSVENYGLSSCPGCGPNGEDEEYSDGERLESDQPGVFDERADSLGGSSNQASVVSPAALRGDGSIGIGFASLTSGRSYLQVVFEVGETGLYSLSGERRSQYLNGVVSISLEDASGTLFEEAGYGPDVDPFQEQLQLTAGTAYTLTADVFGESFGLPESSSWSFTLVPEPGTAWLLGVGLCAIAWRARRS